MKKTFFMAILGFMMAAIIGGVIIIATYYNVDISEKSKINLYFAYSLLFFVFSMTFLWQWLIHYKNTVRLNAMQRQTEIQLFEEKNKFESLFDQSKNSIALISLDGRFQRVNHATCELLGQNENDMLAMNYFYLLNQNDLNNLQVNIQHLIDKSIKVYRSEHECFKKNGEMIWILSTLSLIRDHMGEPNYFIIQMDNITLQKNAQDRLRKLAYHDPLTGLANRNKLEQFINHLLLTARRKAQYFALLFLDLDGFKNINDSIGHEAGDLLLQVIAERLHNAVRVTDMVVRLGGDEFVVVVIDVVKTEAVALIAQKILESVLQAIIIKGQDIYITTSIGISIYPYDGQNLQTLMKCADLALYRAKEQGRNNFQFYTQEMTTKAKAKMDIKKALSQALAKKEFVLYYQPQMDIQTRRIIGMEALLRWKTEHFGEVRPEEIIALSEESGLIIPVSEWILSTACEQLKKWHDSGFPSLTMAINCTTRQFKQTTFINGIQRAIAEFGIAPSLLEIEITESMVMKDPEKILLILDALKEIGVKIVIDDFGTGYWSIGNLRRLSVDKIKMDKTFISHIADDETSAEITSAMIAMLNKLGTTSVAEGVETREQYEFLAREGCNVIQGYYLTQPLPSESMTYFLHHPVPDAEVISVEQE